MRAALLTVFLTGCATARPDYYTPADCQRLRAEERRALTVQEASGYLGPALAVGGLLWQALADTRSGPVALAVAGAGAGATAAAAGRYASSARAEWEEGCRELPAGVAAALVPEVRP